MTKLINQRYRLVEPPLGRGGMGRVYKAYDTKDSREVAIKLMHEHFSTQPSFQKRFFQEASLLTSLNHEHIVTVFGSGLDGEQLYIVMELIEGRNLREWVTERENNRQDISLNEKLRLVSQTAYALNYIHRQNITHRDIKPENIMIAEGGSSGEPVKPILTDFGLARIGASVGLTVPGDLMGTPTYMSPEQFLNKEGDVGTPSDVYSLGVILYELLNGYPPKRLGTLTDAFNYHKELPSPDKLPFESHIPDAVVAITRQALIPYSDNRISAQSLADSLGSGLTQVRRSIPYEIPAEAEHVQISRHEAFAELILSRFPHVQDPESSVLQVMGTQGKIQSFKLQGDVVFIGNGDNERCPLKLLNDGKVSPIHAKIEFEGVAKVTDLNGDGLEHYSTYIGTTKLLPGVPERWAADRLLRIGDHYLRYVPSGNFTVVGPSPKPSEKDRRVKFLLNVENKHLHVEPGQSVALTAAVTNLEPTVEQVKLLVRGLPNDQDWIVSSTEKDRHFDESDRRGETVSLSEGQSEELEVLISPPQEPASHAHTYSFWLMLVNQNRGDIYRRESCSLTVHRFSKFAVGVAPTKVRVSRTFKVTVENQGNSQERYSIQARDMANALTLTAKRHELHIAPGENDQVIFKTALESPRKWFGDEKHHQVTVEVAPSAGDAESSTKKENRKIDVTSRARFPKWVAQMLPFILLGILGAGGLGIIRWRGQIRDAAQFAINATATFDAANVVATKDYNDRIATSTAIAIERTGDTDRDGLTNLQEEALGTNPNKRDSDDDGLDDGDEIERNTNPLAPDTDEDGTNDGDEVRKGQDPTSPDVAATPNRSESVVPPTTQPCVVTQAGIDLRLRSGPGEAFNPPIRLLAPGQRLMPVAYQARGVPDKEWIQVTVAETGQQGWVVLNASWVECVSNVRQLPTAVPPSR